MAGAAALAVVLPALVVVVPVAEAATTQGFRAPARHAAPMTFRQNQAPSKPISSAPPRQYLAPSKPFTPMISKQAPGRQVSPMPSQQKPVLSPSSQRATGPSPGVKLSPGRDLSRLTAQPKPATPMRSRSNGREGRDQVCKADPAGAQPIRVEGRDQVRGSNQQRTRSRAAAVGPNNPILEPPNIVLDPVESTNGKLKPPGVPPAGGDRGSVPRSAYAVCRLRPQTPVPPPTQCPRWRQGGAPIPTPGPSPYG